VRAASSGAVLQVPKQVAYVVQVVELLTEAHRGALHGEEVMQLGEDVASLVVMSHGFDELLELQAEVGQPCLRDHNTAPRHVRMSIRPY